MKYAYKVGCSIENLKGVRDFVRVSLQKHGVSELDISELVLAIDEMCSNLMIHAHHCNPDEMFELHVIANKGEPLVFEIIDDGSVFDINRFHEPNWATSFTKKEKAAWASGWLSRLWTA
ncbi:ATP-binding protein [Oscillatoria amoena NRMC-F 0135]|nr:ATP-binding protein [Oscillatoria amoena NRMC-F 0135]